MDDARKLALRQQIAQAFADVGYPGDDRIGDPKDWESADLIAAFKGRRWQDLTADDLWKNSATFLRPEGLRYYLPAYLIAALDGAEGGAHGEVLALIVHGLHLDKVPALATWSRNRFALFTPAQRQVVRAFLEYVRDEMVQTCFPDDRAVSAALASWNTLD